jgi:methyl-accepting chemotaxis protein
LTELARSGLPQAGATVSEDGLSLAVPVLAAPEGPAVGIVAMAWSDGTAVEMALAEHRRVIIEAIAVLAVVSLAVLWLLRRQLGRPLSILRASVGTVARGDYDMPVPMQDRRDEIGGIAADLAGLVDGLKKARSLEEAQAAAHQEQARVVESLAQGLDALSHGLLSRRITGPFPSEYETLRDNFNRAIDSVGDAIRAVGETAASIRSGSDEIAAASDDLSRRTETQAATLEQTAAALDELSASVRVTATNADDADRAVQTAREKAARNDEVMRQAMSAMSAIETSSGQIGEIISVIDDIAFQTNLLALNAGVEAARAGESGKGFAVVASEVRALAQRSSDAARQIKDLISGSSEQVKSGVDLVQRAGAALEDVVREVADISQLVSGIAKAANEQAQGLTQINAGVASLDQVTQQNAAMVEEATAATHMLRQQAEGLSGQVERFDLSGPEAAATPAIVRAA